MEQVVVLTLFMILIVSLYLASFLMIASIKNWIKKRDKYYDEKLIYLEQKTHNSDELHKVLDEVKEILNQINKQNGTRTEPMDQNNI